MSGEINNKIDIPYVTYLASPLRCQGHFASNKVSVLIGVFPTVIKIKPKLLVANEMRAYFSCNNHISVEFSWNLNLTYVLGFLRSWWSERKEKDKEQRKHNLFVSIFGDNQLSVQ